MESEYSFDVFHGELTHDAAQIYVRVPGLAGGQRWTISGTLRGPECRYAKTLPIHVPLVDCGAGPTLLARGLLTEPCFWSTELPMIYQLHVEVRLDGSLVTQHEQELGLRFLGVRKNSFYWMGQRWVLRGVFQEQVPVTPLDRWKEYVAAMITAEPTDELCREASREGVLVVARIGGTSSTIERELRRLARWPAVGMALIEGLPESSTEFRRIAPNLLLGTRIIEQIPPWSDFSIVSYEEIRNVSEKRLGGRPVLIRRPIGNVASLAEARRQCEVLQRDVASIGDFAGYVV